MKKPKVKFTFYDEKGNEIDAELIDPNSLYKEQDDLYRSYKKKSELEERQRLDRWLADRSGVYTTREDGNINVGTADRYTIIQDIYLNRYYRCSGNINIASGICNE